MSLQQKPYGRYEDAIKMLQQEMDAINKEIDECHGRKFAVYKMLWNYSKLIDGEESS